MTRDADRPAPAAAPALPSPGRGFDAAESLDRMPEEDVGIRIADAPDPFRLIACFGDFRSELRRKTGRRKIAGKMAFACERVPARAGQAPSAADRLRVARITYAIDMFTGRPHRLIWIVTAAEEILTFFRPALPEQEAGQPAWAREARFLPIDAATFAAASAAVRPPRAGTGRPRAGAAVRSGLAAE